MDVELNIINDNIYHFNYPTQYLLCSTHMRLQEFYESPLKDIRGKYFSHEQYMDRYAEEYGNFTYYSDWGGFNVPGHIIDIWRNNFIIESRLGTNVFSNKEFNLLKKLTDPLIKGEKFYVIGTYGENSSCFQHELSHAMYYLNDKYKKEVNRNIKKFSRTKEISKCLLEHGYDKSVLKDEIQAYMATGTVSSVNFALEFETSEDEMQSFKDIYNKYYKGLNI